MMISRSVQFSSVLSIAKNRTFELLNVGENARIL